MTLATSNPLLQPWDTPYGLPPFAAVRPEHFAPGFDAALKAHRAEIDAIGHNPAPPSFENTIAAFDRCGRLYYRIEGLFYNLTASETSPALQKVEREMAPVIAAHSNAIYMHKALFDRIDVLHAQRETLASRRSRSACSSVSTSISCTPARAWPARRSSATAR
jgi:peptidyl-dipeptidase Dcp